MDIVICGEGEGFKRAMTSLDTGRIGIGCQALELAQAAMEESVRYAKQRVAFGQPIGHLQAIQFKLADMSAGIEAARWRLRHAAWLKNQGRPIIREAAEAKVYQIWEGTSEIQRMVIGRQLLKEY